MGLISDYVYIMKVYISSVYQKMNIQ